MLIEVEKGKTFLDIVDLKLKLEEKLKRKVDLVEYGAIDPIIKEGVLNDQKKIYEKKS